jgi:hypothetical protein
MESGYAGHSEADLYHRLGKLEGLLLAENDKRDQLYAMLHRMVERIERIELRQENFQGARDSQIAVDKTKESSTHSFFTATAFIIGSVVVPFSVAWLTAYFIKIHGTPEPAGSGQPLPRPEASKTAIVFAANRSD